MQTKILLRNTFFMSYAIGVFLTWAYLFSEILNISIIEATHLTIPYKIQQNKVSIERTLPINPKKQKNITTPILLQIPRIQVNTNIIPVWLTPQGAMAMPEWYSDVGWYNSWVYPGEHGTAVIAVHYWILRNGTISVFNNLSKLEKWDMISIVDNNGRTTTFVVRKSRLYSEYEDTSSVFISSDKNAHLNLITCQGIWNKVSKSYPNRLVIFTDKMD